MKPAKPKNPTLQSRKPKRVIIEGAHLKHGTCLRRWNCAMAVLAAIVIALIAVVVIIAVLVVNPTRDSNRRYCLVANGANAGTASTGEMIGGLRMDVNDREVEWDLQYFGLSGPVLGLVIHGPIPAGLEFGPVAFALCGAPSSLLCDLSTPNVLKGTINEIDPGGASLRPAIQAIRDEPWRYYAQVNTPAFDGTSDNGEIAAPINALCGTP